MYPETVDTPVPEHLFDDKDTIVIRYASKGQRIANYLTDTIFMEYGIGIATTYAFEKFLESVDPEVYADFFGDGGTAGIILIAYGVSIINYLLYYTFCEKVFGGVTLGKLFSGTQAVRTDGEPLRLRDAFLRTLCRCIPFEPFSGFGNSPWHDRWTNTMVIKKD